jgi:hypothetical protein
MRRASFISNFADAHFKFADADADGMVIDAEAVPHVRVAALLLPDYATLSAGWCKRAIRHGFKALPMLPRTLCAAAAPPHAKRFDGKASALTSPAVAASFAARQMRTLFLAQEQTQPLVQRRQNLSR